MDYIKEFEARFPAIEWTTVVEKTESKNIPNTLVRKPLPDGEYNINANKKDLIDWLKQTLSKAKQEAREEERERIYDYIEEEFIHDLQLLKVLSNIIYDKSLNKQKER